MRLGIGSIWDYVSDVYLVNTHSVTNSKGELVMGSKLCNEAKIRYPNLPVFLGSRRTSTYGVMIDGSIGSFQIQHSYKYPIQLDLIEYSTDMLIEYLEENNVSVVMSYPGYGLDGVDAILSRLPDNVLILIPEELAGL